ncbi:hypothetical protein Naga_100732g1 [Nannochloropsis gaditana]|uniref:Uncharacterized protein n=1 Tax=Nannochloropsis gaditana TaxID=72520 RepID=W7TTE7_9STRA|nr:hypothetical protein Naga_100732g1 [Nannochloropsis gaditana]
MPELKEDLVTLLGDISPVPVTYAGGARSIEDLERVTELGKNKCLGYIRWCVELLRRGGVGQAQRVHLIPEIHSALSVISARRQGCKPGGESRW